MESIILLAVALCTIIVFLILSAGFIADLNVQSQMNDAQSSASSLAEAADFVYAQGEGANRTVLIKLPLDTDFEPWQTYIGLQSNGMRTHAHNTINIDVGGKDASATTTAPVTGIFPQTAGAHGVQVVSRGSFVSIGHFPVDVRPHSVSLSMGRNETRNVSLFFAFNQTDLPSNFGTKIVVIAESDWNYADASMLFASPVRVLNMTYPNPTYVPPDYTFNTTGRLMLAPGTANGSIYLAFNTSSASAGIYNSQVYISVFNGICYLENFAVPVQLQVVPG